MLNFQRNCDVQTFLRKNKNLSQPYGETANYLNELDSKIKHEIVCVGE